MSARVNDNMVGKVEGKIHANKMITVTISQKIREIEEFWNEFPVVIGTGHYHKPSIGYGVELTISNIKSEKL